MRRTTCISIHRKMIFYYKTVNENTSDTLSRIVLWYLRFFYYCTNPLFFLMLSPSNVFYELLIVKFS